MPIRHRALCKVLHNSSTISLVKSVSLTIVQVAVEYEAFHVKEGLTLQGLQQTYDDGIGDVDTDYDTLGLADLVRLLLVPAMGSLVFFL